MITSANNAVSFFAVSLYGHDVYINRQQMCFLFTSLLSIVNQQSAKFSMRIYTVGD